MADSRAPQSSSHTDIEIPRIVFTPTQVCVNSVESEVNNYENIPSLGKKLKLSWTEDFPSLKQFVFESTNMTISMEFGVRQVVKRKPLVMGILQLYGGETRNILISPVMIAKLSSENSVRS